jgi:hypothetical protein
VDKYYPVPSPSKFQSAINSLSSLKISDKCYHFLIDTIIEYGGVFFGGYAMELYAKYIDIDVYHALRSHRQLIYAFASEPKILLNMIKSKAEFENLDMSYIKHPAVGDIINIHYEVIIDGVSVGIIYEPIGCHSYNTIRIHKQYVKIATIYTILHMYYSFIYIDAPYYNHYLLNYISTCLYNIKQTHTSTGILQIFPITCYGHQETKGDILSKRATLFSDLKKNPNDSKLNKYFFKYYPANNNKDSSEYESSSGKYASLDNITSSFVNNSSKKNKGNLISGLSKLFTNPLKNNLFSSKTYKRPRSQYRNKTFNNKYIPYKPPINTYKENTFEYTPKNKRFFKSYRANRSPKTGIFKLYNK